MPTAAWRCSPTLPASGRVSVCAFGVQCGWEQYLLYELRQAACPTIPIGNCLIKTKFTFLFITEQFVTLIKKRLISTQAHFFYQLIAAGNKRQKNTVVNKP